MWAKDPLDAAPVVVAAASEPPEPLESPELVMTTEASLPLSSSSSPAWAPAPAVELGAVVGGAVVGGVVVGGTDAGHGASAPAPGPAPRQASMPLTGVAATVTSSTSSGSGNTGSSLPGGNCTATFRYHSGCTPWSIPPLHGSSGSPDGSGWKNATRY